MARAANFYLYFLSFIRTLESKMQQEESYELRSDAATAPHPLPMPEYGGYFAQLSEFLPDINLPISGFHR